MATARLADRRIRAAAHAALRLDVRGPVSEALGKTGIAVPPADEAPAAPPPPAPASTRTVGRAPRREKGLAPTVKPFAEAPWPTRPASLDPLSGLTADERRVHRILLDTLDLTARQGDLAAGLGYAERKRLEALDLAFINAQLAKAEGGSRADRALPLAFLIVGVALVAVAMGGAAVNGALAAAGTFAAFLGGAGLAGLIPTAHAGRGLSAQRTKIYEALRELALLVEPAPASEAVAEADRIIDALADADLAASDRGARPTPRVRA